MQTRLDESEPLREQLADARERERQLAASLEIAKTKVRNAIAARQVERERLQQQLTSAFAETAAERRANRMRLREIRHLREAVGHRTHYVDRLEAQYEAATRACKERDDTLAHLSDASAARGLPVYRFDTHDEIEKRRQLRDLRDSSPPQTRRDCARPRRLLGRSSIRPTG